MTYDEAKEFLLIMRQLPSQRGDDRPAPYEQRSRNDVIRKLAAKLQEQEEAK